MWGKKRGTLLMAICLISQQLPLAAAVKALPSYEEENVYVAIGSEVSPDTPGMADPVRQQGTPAMIGAMESDSAQSDTSAPDVSDDANSAQTDTPAPDVSDDANSAQTDTPAPDVSDDASSAQSDTPAPDASDDSNSVQSDTPTPDASDDSNSAQSDTPTPDASDDSNSAQSDTPTSDASDESDSVPSSNNDTRTFPYQDVQAESPYYAAVQYLWERHYLTDEAPATFYPEEPITAADAAQIAILAYCAIHQSAYPVGTDPNSYLRQAIQAGMLPSETMADQLLSHEQLMQLLSSFNLPLEELRVIESLPDVEADSPDADRILSLYRAGVYSGSDEYGTFERSANTTRGAFALAIAALLEPSFRSAAPLGGKPYGMEAFAVESSVVNPFTDVNSDSWYYPSILAMYGLGLFNGIDEDTFAPSDTISIAQFETAAVRIYERYQGISSDFTSLSRNIWYEPYINKAAEYGFLPKDAHDFTTAITRRQAAYTLYRLLPEEELAVSRPVYRLPDLSPIDAQFGEIMTLYSAGILNGNDGNGAFQGEQNLTRAEAATFFFRLVSPAQRVTAAIQPVSGMAAFNIDAPNFLTFTDVPTSASYAKSVNKMHQLGLLSGKTPTTFSPDSPMSLAEAIALAVRVYEYYHGLVTSNEQAGTASDWYMPYVELGKQYTVSDGGWTEFLAPVTREQLAYLVYHSLPIEELPPINDVTLLPDVSSSHPYYKEIIGLYNAGIVSGDDEFGTFAPSAVVSRAETAEVFGRLIQPEERQTFSIKRDLRELQTLITQAISRYYGTWSVYFCDVKTDTDFSINNRRMWSASVLKLYVMAAVMDQMEKGLLQNSYSIQSDLTEMITDSSNTAWYSLYRTLGRGNYSAGVQLVNNYCKTQGYPNSGHLTESAPYNSTSVEDTGLFLRRVLKGTNVSLNASKQMLELMKQQHRTWKIPAGVPSGVVTANKTGELYASTPVENDAAIVFSPAGTYILVVLTQNGSVDNIKSLSSMIYHYLNP